MSRSRMSVLIFIYGSPPVPPWPNGFWRRNGGHPDWWGANHATLGRFRRDSISGLNSLSGPESESAPLFEGLFRRRIRGGSGQRTESGRRIAARRCSDQPAPGAPKSVPRRSYAAQGWRKRGDPPRSTPTAVCHIRPMPRCIAGCSDLWFEKLGFPPVPRACRGSVRRRRGARNGRLPCILRPSLGGRIAHGHISSKVLKERTRRCWCSSG